jgi:dipeptidyl aminopeptidase/acylaminoacyl peptidase
VQVRGSSFLYRVPVDGGKPSVVIGDEGSVESWALTPSGGVIYGFASPTEPAMLRERAASGSTRDIVKLNTALLTQRRISPVEAVTFKAKDGLPVEAYITMPLNRAPNHTYPMVITRYSYKPTASEGLTRFDDNKRLHIFVADLATGQVKQVTTGNYYEHSIQWSPDGKEILFISNHGGDPDRVFNYDVFALNLASGAIRQITNTRNAEYQPVWSPDGRTIAYLGTKRELTSSETTMEDTHVWIMNSDGSNRREL